MAQINLLNKGANDRANISSIISQIIFWLVLLGLIAISAYYIYLYFNTRKVNSSIIEAQNAVKEITDHINTNSSRDEIITRQGQIKEYQQLDKNRIKWSQFIPELARITLNEVRYSSITATSDGKLELQAVTRDYKSVDRFLSVFEDKSYNRCITDVKLLSLSKTQSAQSLETRFTVQISFNPAMLKPLTLNSDSISNDDQLCK